MKIEGAVALVTGASRGIGKQFVEELQTAGATRIYIGVRDTGAVAEIVSIDPERIIPIQLDVTLEKSIQDAAAHCQDVNLLINNAGVLKNQGLIAAPDISSARAEMEVNYFGTLLMCRAFAPILKANAGGAIINVLSILARINFPPEGFYSASKAAALSLTQGVRAELAPQKTLVVAVMPGRVDTDMTKNEQVEKISPTEVASSDLQAVVDEVEEVYVGEEAKSLAAQLASNPKAIEKQIAQMLPTS